MNEHKRERHLREVLFGQVQEEGAELLRPWLESHQAASTGAAQPRTRPNKLWCGRRPAVAQPTTT
jgi:hypothetical protein